MINSNSGPAERESTIKTFAFGCFASYSLRTLFCLYGGGVAAREIVGNGHAHFSEVRIFSGTQE